MKKLSLDTPSPNPNREGAKQGLMVCVTGQRSCERLVVHGKNRLAPDQILYVVHCVPEGKNFLGSSDESDAINYLFNISKNVGAELTILRENDVIDALVDFANEHNIHVIVVGRSPSSAKDSFNNRFSKRLPGVEFDIVM